MHYIHSLMRKTRRVITLLEVLKQGNNANKNLN